MKSEFKGIVSVLASALLFYLATFFVKLGLENSPHHSPADTVVYLAARFWIGYFFMELWFPLFRTKGKTRASKMPVVNRRWLWLRAFWNLVAVMFFYLGVIYGNVTAANILNMTYPVFVALLSVYFLNEKPGIITWVGVLFSVAGAIFVSINVGASSWKISTGDIFSLLSAVTAGIAIVALRIIRLTDTTEAALFYNFRLGFWGTLVPVIYFIIHRNIENYSGGWVYPLLSGITGILGQAALTYGFKFVTAVQGSILSAARLVFAVVIGWIFFQTEITVYSISGALFILLANIILSFKRK
ncbi:MAG: DMT family transporter [Spirochaetia bacterium]|nr:DMT family transporter [Spirochaetia bacterium]